jgi:ABC-2 type transport system permease protein
MADRRDRMGTVTTRSGSSRAAPAPLVLLLRIHALQLWRRIQSIRDQSGLLTSVIALFLTGYLGLSFWLFYKGLEFLAAFPGLGNILTERLLYVMFAFLFALLLLSNLVISHTNLFRNREATFLLTQPVSRQTIFRWKFIESTLLASWAFLFLIAPLLAAFGLVRGAPWHFYPMTLLLIGLFIVLPGVIGSWLAIHVARYFDRRSFQITVICCALLLLGLAAFFWKAQPATDDILTSRVLEMLDRLLFETRFTQYPFLPSFWLTRGVVQWADGAYPASIFFTLVLLSHVTFFGFLAFTRLGNAFYDTASAVQSRTSAYNGTAQPGKGSFVPPWTERWMNNLIPWLRRDVHALLLKDARMFWRDTAQWGQCVMFFGLLGMYFINLRHFTHDLTSPFWTSLIAYLNLSACSLNLATLTTRFVYPQFSLEGRRLWIVGLAPLGLVRVVLVKYWLASFLSLAVTLTLITLSCSLLHMSWDQLVFFGTVVTVMTFSLNGLAIGLGVLFPNFKESNPGKIVSGFGGTLCLVLSFLYISASVALLGFGTSGLHLRADWALESVATFLFLSVLTGWLPLRAGLRQLRHFEF